MAGEGEVTAGPPEVVADEVLYRLGLVPSPTELSEVIRVRIDRDLLDRLDRIESVLRGQGYRQVTRSSLIRAAISGFVEGVQGGGPS